MERNLFCFWFGPEMSDNRKNSVAAIQENSKVLVKLITEENMHEYEVKEFPIHAGFKHLSATHKSDYMRSYLMYFYGGGYTDIKQCNFNWNPYFDQLEKSDKQFIGYPEKAPFDVGYAPAAPHFANMAGMCQYIFKPKTDIAKKWLEETKAKMDYILPELEYCPGTYHPRAVKGGAQGIVGQFQNSTYPLAWTELLGYIFHKVQYENMGKYLLNFPYPVVGNHR